MKRYSRALVGAVLVVLSLPVSTAVSADEIDTESQVVMTASDGPQAESIPLNSPGVVSMPASAESNVVYDSQLDPTQQETIDQFMADSVEQTVELSNSSASLDTFYQIWSFDVKATKGSFMMGAETQIQGATNSSTIIWEYAKQTARYSFPNTAESKGIDKYRNTSTDKRYDSKFKLGAGTVTPWGSVNVYSFWHSQWGEVTPNRASVRH